MPSSQWSFLLSLYFKIITFPGPLRICIPFLLYFSTLLHSTDHIIPYIFILCIVCLPQPVCNLHEDNRILVWMFFVLFYFVLVCFGVNISWVLKPVPGRCSINICLMTKYKWEVYYKYHYTSANADIRRYN